MKKAKLTKVLSLILALSILMMSIPAFSMSAAAETARDYTKMSKTADPSTMDSWQDMFPADDTAAAGSIWTDKTVLTDTSSLSGLVDANDNPVSIGMVNENNNFLVVLSALASNKSIVGYSYTPTDTMLVLDASASMGNSGYVDDLVTSANAAIEKLLGLNRHNRVGVVLYSGSSQQGNSAGSTATVLLPIDRYTHANNEFLTNSGQSRISVNSYVRDGNNNLVDTRSKAVSGGTYIQNGVYMAMEEFLEVTDTVIPDGEIQAGTTRTPIFVLMSDGEPTTATTNFAGQNNSNNTVGLGTSNLGDGTNVTETNLQNTIDFVNQLTAAYVVSEVDKHYAAADPLFYTLGVGANNNTLDSAVLDPDSFTTTDDLWEEYVNTQNNSNLLVDIEDGYNPDQASVRKIAAINSIEQKNYVTRYFPASNAGGLNSAFDSIVKQIIIQSLYYPTLVEGDNHDHDGFVEFHDDIGHYMDVKEIKGIMIGKTLFTGERLASAFTEDSLELKNADGTPTAKGDNVVWSVMQRIGIDDVQVARDLINSAYLTGQLRYWEDTGEWSNYIGWYADDNGNFMGHWHEGHTAEDIPVINGVKATHINRSYGMLGEVTSEHAATDLMYISTQVHTRIADNNVSVIWKIPASLVPVVSYNITIDGENLSDATSATINYAAAEPIRIVFEVGLNDDINFLNLVDKITDPAAHINDANGDGASDDNKYYFYTNWFDGNINHEHFPTTEDTIVFFEPSIKNERYYYNEETAVYINTAAAGATPVYEKYNGSAVPAVGDGRTYYREFVSFKGTNIIREHEAMSDETISVLTAAHRNTDGTWDVPAGTVHRLLEPYNVEKTSNTTGSLEYVRYPVVEEIPAKDSFYIGYLLGNNGMLSIDIPRGIKITKRVDDTLLGTDDTYTFRLDTGENTFGQYVNAYHEAADGTITHPTVYIIGGVSVVELKANESLYIVYSGELDLTITEDINGSYKVASVEIDGVLQNGTTANASRAEAGFSEVVFTNTRVVNDGTIIVSKEIVHDEAITYNEDQLYTFEWYNVNTPNDKQTFSIKASETKTLSGLTPGDTYVISEINIPAGYEPRNNNIQVTLPNNAAAVVPVHFINDYTPAEAKPDNIIVSGQKHLEGREWLANDSFTVRLQMLDGAIWKNIGNVRTVTGANSKYTFDFAQDIDLQTFAFTEVGDYRFRVIEEIPDTPLGGITYDTTYHYFTVSVTDAEMDGALEINKVTADKDASITQNGQQWFVNANFTNAYAPHIGDELIITIDKVVTDTVGTNHSREGFVFGLFAVGGTEPIIVSDPTNANGYTDFDLTFPATDAGREYNFEIREIVPDDKKNGMDYDDTAHQITIKIVDNLDGTVEAVVATQNGDLNGVEVGFVNVYDPDDVYVNILGNKTLTGRDMNAGEFTFLLIDENGVTVQTASNKGAGANSTFEFIRSFDRVGTYKYTIAEQKGNALGVKYSDKEYALEVVVSDDTDNDGVLNAAVYIDGALTEQSATVNKIVFENSYAPAVGDEFEIYINKVMIDNVGSGKTPEGYSFGVFEAGTDNLVAQATTGADGKATITLTFDASEAGKEYSFELREIVPANALKGMEYDDTVNTFKIRVIDNLDGTVTAKAENVHTYVESGFNNYYDPADAVVVLSGHKTMEGREFENGEFTFELLAKGETVPMSASTADSVDGKATFSFQLSFDKVGEYKYTLTEKGGTAGGVTYDDRVYNITVTVSDDLDNDGVLDATVTNDSTEEFEGELNALVFKNSYKATPGIIEIAAKKTLIGRDLAAGEFEFSLYDENNNLIETVKNAADGSITFAGIAVDAAGEYVFYVKENAGDDENITYDEKVYKVTVTVTDNLEGDLDIAYAYGTDAGAENEVIFENEYTEPEPPVVPDIPQTGDYSNINLWLALFFVSGGLLGVSIVTKKRKHSKN
ncbi:MAG: hypothetical protein IKL62_06710 [Clostridia bacterium]|nr:hypothetical protein [Clostridia bacterium]